VNNSEMLDHYWRHGVKQNHWRRTLEFASHHYGDQCVF